MKNYSSFDHNGKHYFIDGNYYCTVRGDMWRVSMEDYNAAYKAVKGGEHNDR